MTRARHGSRPLRAAALLSLLLIGAAGCGEDDPPAPAGGGAATDGAPLPDSLALASEPSGARPIGEVIASLQQDRAAVVARGRVGEEGASSSWFTLADGSLKSCVETGDACETPWDYCCTPNDVKQKQMATVELRVGGALVDRSVIGWHGVDHLKEVVVAGQATKDSGGNVTIVASGIWVKP
jgi:hypothetical protein